MALVPLIAIGVAALGLVVLGSAGPAYRLGAALPTAYLEASLISGSSRHFLVYRNYDVLLDYNCAHAYALSVGLLSDRVAN